MMNSRFSVCMATYKNDDPENLRTAINSIYTNQTVKPSEVILVVDGQIPDRLRTVISEMQDQIDVLNVIYLEQNMGHAVARQTGVEAAATPLIALMDADDISISERFEMQLRAFQQHPDVTVVGGLIHEFVGEPTNVVGTRVCPQLDIDIKKYLKSRCPMNQVTVMFKKENVMSVGGYQDWYCEEDYYLWIRLTLAGFKFFNLQENLVNVRVGDKAYQRRGGYRYFKSEAKLQKYMFSKNIISCWRYMYNVLIRLIVQVLMPNAIRGWVFQKFARSK